MKLLTDFISIVAHSITEKGFGTTVKFNPTHIIYRGHFPGYPVTPGVIQMQIVHELLEEHLGRKLKLVSMPQCKFLRVLNPDEAPVMEVNVGYKHAGNLIHVSASGASGTDLFFKLNATYQFDKESVNNVIPK